MAPGSNLPVKVDVSNFLETGEATAPVQANGAVLAVLRAERASAPFGVTLDGTPAEKPEVAMKPDAEASLVLRNADAVNYRVGWELEAGGHVVTNGVAYLAPTSTTRLLIHPPESFLGWGLCGFMRDEWKEGKLLIWWRGADGTVKKEKVMPLRFRVQPVGETGRMFGYIFVLVVLTAGGFSSLALNNGIPNYMKRLDFKEELSTLAKRIHNLTPQLDSELRVLVRVERKRLEGLLESRVFISPDLVTVFKNVTAGIAGLNRQIEVLERMDALYDRLEALRRAPVPPTVVEVAKQRLQTASVLLRSTAPSENDMLAAQALVAEARQLVENIDKPSELLPAKLAARVKALRKDFAGPLADDATVANLKQQLPTLFDDIATADYETPANITPDLYARLDARTRRLELVADYAMVGRNALDAERKQLFKEWGEWMVSNLQSAGFAALEQAQKVLRVLQEWTFPGEFLNAIADGKAAIQTDLMRPKENDPLQFQVHFEKENLNGASARQIAACHWDFGDGFMETGWKVSHYFPVAANYQVKATITHPSKPSADIPAKKVTVTPLTTARKLLSARTRVELIRASIALAAALLALVGGAREQLMHLDCMAGLVAVFLAGFGADTIKNLLTQRQ